MKTKDGRVIIAPISQKNFEQMADAIYRPDLKTEVRFATDQARVEHWPELMTIIGQWTGQRSGVGIEAIMNGSNVPCSRFLTVSGAATAPSSQRTTETHRLFDVRVCLTLDFGGPTSRDH